jgi:hypothetical protein
MGIAIPRPPYYHTKYMLTWLRRMMGGGEEPRGKARPTKASSRADGPAAVTSRQRLIESLDDLIKSPGKACYRTLVELATSSTKDQFTDIVHCPAFVGSGIRDGELERIFSTGQGGKFQKTHMFNPSVRSFLVEGASIEQSIFLLRKPRGGSSADLTRFTIGRVPDNDILMNDVAISRAHAVVEIRGEGYYLKDLGSSNGTFVKGKLIDDRGTRLNDGDTVLFARYEFQFLTTEGLFDLLSKRSVAVIDAAL